MLNIRWWGVVKGFTVSFCTDSRIWLFWSSSLARWTIRRAPRLLTGQICAPKRHIYASSFNKCSCPSKRHTSICASSFNKYICPSKRHICASSFNKCSYPSRAISDISKLVTISILVSSSSAFIDMPRSTLSYKNSWSQGRPSSSPVQSIVTCECHNHVVSV